MACASRQTIREQTSETYFPNFLFLILELWFWNIDLAKYVKLWTIGHGFFRKFQWILEVIKPISEY